MFFFGTGLKSVMINKGEAKVCVWLYSRMQKRKDQFHCMQMEFKVAGEI